LIPPPSYKLTSLQNGTILLVLVSQILLTLKALNPKPGLGLEFVGFMYNGFPGMFFFLQVMWVFAGQRIPGKYLKANLSSGCKGADKATSNEGKKI
jgi:hypothetical protein